MLKYKQGNLITMAQDGEFDVIVHGCNCFHAMGAGIAPQIANAFRGVREADFDTMYGCPKKLGKYSMSVVEADGKPLYILNAYTQFDTGHGRRVEYTAIANVFKNIALEFHQDLKIGIPKIGAGLAGGCWDLISELISSSAPKSDITCVIYSP